MFRQGFTCPALLKDRRGAFRLRGSHPLRPTFPDPSARPTATTGLVRFRSPLLAESRLMSVPPGTEMFQFPGFASWAYGFSPGSPKGRGFPIRTSADQRSLASPRGFSQRATSFIASRRQGIHRTPLSCSGQNKRPATQQQPTNQPTPLKQNQTPPPPTPTPAAARATDNGRTNNRTDGRRHPSHNTSNPDSAVKEQAAAASRRKPARGGGGKGFRRQASRQKPAAPTHACMHARAARAAPARLVPAGLEAIGFEPTTPCLQSRCSPS